MVIIWAGKHTLLT